MVDTKEAFSTISRQTDELDELLSFDLTVIALEGSVFFAWFLLVVYFGSITLA